MYNSWIWDKYSILMLSNLDRFFEPQHTGMCMNIHEKYPQNFTEAYRMQYSRFMIHQLPPQIDSDGLNAQHTSKAPQRFFLSPMYIDIDEAFFS